MYIKGQVKCNLKSAKISRPLRQYVEKRESCIAPICIKLPGKKC